jgi:hypothetical protein
MSAKTFSLSVVAALALLASGCGGGGGTTATAGAAEILPADLLLYVSLNVDSGSEQWDMAEALIDKFPDGRRALRLVIQELREDQDRDWKRDIEPALGDQVAIAILGVRDNEPVLAAVLKPDDEEKLRQLLEDDNNEPTVTREIEGWTVISDKESSLDAVARVTDSDNTLAEARDFQTTMDELGDEALALAYVNGARAVEVVRELATEAGEAQQFEQILGQGLGNLDAAGTALLARDDGVEWKAFAKVRPTDTDPSGIGFQASFDTTLDEQVPAGALAFLSFTGTNYRQQLRGLTPQQQTMLRQFERMLGFSVDDLADLLSSEGAFYVRPGAPFPEGTLILRTDDETKARAVLDRLARRLAALGEARVEPTQIAGVEAGQVRLGGITVVYAVFDGMAVVTSTAAGIEALREDGDKLSGDAAFTDALDAAGVPDRSSGFLYWNIEDTVPLIRSYADLSDQELPPQLWANLRPLRSLVFHASGEQGEARFSALLTVD